MISETINYLSSKKILLVYASVGITATLTHSIIYLVFLDIIYTSAQFANLAGFLVALTVSYIGQRKWTFSHKTISNEVTTKFKFVASSFLSLSVNSFWVLVTVDLLSLPPEYSVIGIIFLTPIIIFYVLNNWVFT